MTDLIAAKVTGVAAAGSAIASVFAAVTDAVAISAITSIAAVLMAGVSAYFAYKAKTVAEGTHKAVNSRLDEFMRLAKEKFFADGKLEGTKEARAISDAADKAREQTRKDLEKPPDVP